MKKQLLGRAEQRACHPNRRILLYCLAGQTPTEKGKDDKHNHPVRTEPKASDCNKSMLDGVLYMTSSPHFEQLEGNTDRRRRPCTYLLFATKSNSKVLLGSFPSVSSKHHPIVRDESHFRIRQGECLVAFGRNMFCASSPETHGSTAIWADTKELFCEDAFEQTWDHHRFTHATAKFFHKDIATFCGSGFKRHTTSKQYPSSH